MLSRFAALTVLFWLVVHGPIMAAPAPEGRAAKIPVILDTDIGDDIDDTWALGLLLKSPELDLKLVVSDNGNALYRARILGKFLERCGRTDVAVGIGLRPEDKRAGQSAWIEGYDLKKYPGKVHEDGVQAMIDMVMNSPTPVTLIAIGPVQNLAEALKRKPEIAGKIRFVGMHGSVRRGYNGGSKPAAEFNVKVDARACQKVFSAPWEMTITPLDTCGIVSLKGDKYKAVRESKDPVAAAVIENYQAWATANRNPRQADGASSILFDTVAVYLAFSDELLTIEELSLSVTDDGMTVIDAKGKRMKVATQWKDLAKFEDLLVRRLTSPLSEQ